MARQQSSLKQPSSLNKLKILPLSFLTVTLLFSACSFFGQSPQRQLQAANQGGKNWLADGSIVIARPVPKLSIADSSSMLGFLPQQSQPRGTWLSLNRASGTITLMNGNQAVHRASGEGLDRLRPGRYKILHKQRDALWHADADYFTRRNLPVPAEGHKDRFRRGALGSFVLFLDHDTPIHSGLVWSEEIGGVRLEEEDIARIYYQLELGSVIEVS